MNSAPLLSVSAAAAAIFLRPELADVFHLLLLALFSRDRPLAGWTSLCAAANVNLLTIVNIKVITLNKSVLCILYSWLSGQRR